METRGGKPLDLTLRLGPPTPDDEPLHPAAVHPAGPPPAGPQPQPENPPNSRRNNGNVCGFCNATNTPVCRRSIEGMIMWNACGLRHDRALRRAAGAN